MIATYVVPASRQPPTRPSSISVLPAVDVILGSVTFATPGGYHRYQCPAPEELANALAHAVRPAQWIPEIGTLVITVAQTRVKAGRRIGFGLTAH